MRPVCRLTKFAIRTISNSVVDDYDDEPFDGERIKTKDHNDLAIRLPSKNSDASDAAFCREFDMRITLAAGKQQSQFSRVLFVRFAVAEKKRSKPRTK